MPPLIDPVDLDMFFAKSKPIVVTFMWTPLSVQVVDDTSTLAHRCRCGWGRPSHCFSRRPWSASGRELKFEPLPIADITTCAHGQEQRFNRRCRKQTFNEEL